MRWFVGLAAIASVLPAAAHAKASPGPKCDTILPGEAEESVTRALAPEDLVRLRDIGPVEPQTFAAPFFTVSPDGRWAAFQLRQADPDQNAYCLAMAVVDLLGKVRPRIVDKGGEPILLTTDFRGIADFPSGLMRVITPRWFHDGRSFAFLKRTRGTTQVWRAFADGRGSAVLTNADADVVDFRITPDGSGIVYATRPGLERARRENEQEGLNGWHYDDRFVPMLSKRPMLRAPIERQVQVLDVTDGKSRDPSSEEAALVAVDREIIAVAGDEPANETAGLKITATDLAGGAQPGALSARSPTGVALVCSAPACAGAMYPWWLPGQTHVRFFRREGWAHASTAIYDWDLKNGRVHRLYLTQDVLSSCAADGDSLVCLVDSSLKPRKLVRLDPATGERKILFDPNPEFAQLLLGQPQRLHWRNSFGIETVADLVLPVGYQAGRRYPMVIVQYDTRGFLRGGTDDEYPIQAFANRGYAVLSFSRPRPPVDKARDFEQAGRLSLEEFRDRRSVQSSLEAGVRAVVDRGIADPARIGITGLSDGSTTVEWALNHSSIFSAAAISSCCWDPTFISRVGPSAARHFLAEGYPGILGRTDPFWKDVALEANAERIRTPILVSASEEEVLGALETYTGLREAGVPIDMFVYPDEYHGRWQPAHRLATYRRSLDWFDYWLRGIRSAAPDRQAELKEWDRLREKAGRDRPL
jgi:dipeptidyl aminopeptidase/acylaminoacyl peptidase